MTHLILSREYPPCAYPQGGIGTYVAHVARLLAERGETVHVIGEQWPGAPLPREELCDGHLVVHRVSLTEPLAGTPEADVPRMRRVLDAMKHSEFPAQAFAWQAGLLAESLVEDAGVDCIEAQEYEAPAYYFLLRRAAGLGPGRTPPCFVHLHSPMQFICHYNDWEIGRPDHLTMKRFEDYVIQASDAALCPSRYLGQQVERHYGLPAGSVERIPYPKGDTGVVQRSAETWKSGTICYFGRIEGRKGVHEWIDAVVQVARESPGLRFEFIGSDVQLVAGGHIMVRDALEARIPDDVRPAVSFLGVRPRAELWERLAAARIVVVPSRWENFPNTCVEAMSTGVPVLSSPDGGMVEMLEDGHTGWIADSHRPDALVAALRRALATPAETKAAMGAAAADAIRSICNNVETIDHQLAFRAQLVAQGAGRSLRVPRGHSPLTVLDPSEFPRGPAFKPRARPHQAANEATDPERPRGIAVVVVGGETTGLAACVASLARQTQAVAAVVVSVDTAGSAAYDLAEQECRKAGLPVLGPDPGISFIDVARALRMLLNVAHPPLGVAIIEAGCQLEPHFIERIETMLVRNPAVGLVSSWSERGTQQTSVIVRPSPQRPYQWVRDDLSPACVFRTDGLRSAGWLLNQFGGGLTAQSLALAVLLDEWYGITYPDVLSRDDGVRHALHDAVAWAARTRVLPQMKRQFPAEVSWDAKEILTLVQVHLKPPISAPPSMEIAEMRSPRQLWALPWRAKIGLMRMAVREPRLTAKWTIAQGRRVIAAATRRIRPQADGRS